MKEEFNLSDAIVGIKEVYDEDKVIHIQNVKEFIKRLKEETRHLAKWKVIYDRIDKLAGSELQ